MNRACLSHSVTSFAQTAKGIPPEMVAIKAESDQFRLFRPGYGMVNLRISD
jgi:hypothetical protein